MKKIVSGKNICHKYEHNLKSKIFHVGGHDYHILSKDLIQIYADLSPIYADLDRDYSRVDLIDYEYYERWLNG